jgi:BioD-like phosphotransacetylase family protein
VDLGRAESVVSAKEVSMAALYITSMGEREGNTTLCIGLGRTLAAAGKKVGFLKPVCAATGGDADAGLVKGALGLEEPVESLCGVSGSTAELAVGADETQPPWLKDIEAAFAKVSQGKDVVLLEGVGGVRPGSDAARVAGRTVEALKARTVLVVGPQSELDPDQIVAAAKMFGDSLVGVIANALPEGKAETMKSEVVPVLEASGVRVLGTLPEQKSLYAVTVSELAEQVGGSILNSQDRSGELVESVMVGAMSMDSSLSFLGLKSNKAVIARTDRPDIQLGALETSTRCLVLTGGGEPVPGIVSRALELEVPIVLVEKDTVSTMEAIEKAYDTAGSFGGKKLETLEKALGRSLDLEPITQAA